MKKNMRYALSMLLVLAVTPAAAQTTIVNLPSANPSDPFYTAPTVTQTFGPGTCNVNVIGKANGGQYDPYSFATPAAGNYKADYAYSIDGKTTSVSPFNGERFPDAASALAAYSNVVSSFTLDKATAVSFFIPDTWYYDNLGGLSLGVSNGSPAPVPEPGTMALFGVGAGALIAMRRRKKAAIAH